MASSNNEPKPLSEKDHKLLAYMEQEYLLRGAIPSKEKCIQVGVTDSTHWNKCIKSSDFRNAMVVRGLSLRGYDLNATDQTDYVLTEEQLVAANFMLDLRDNRSQKKKLNDLGITTGKWEAWLRDPAFQSYIRTRAENLLGDNLHESHLALVDRVRSGDINAIKYFNEITGRYVPQSNDKADVNAVLMLVLEVLQQELSSSPELLGRVARRLREIGQPQRAVSPRVIPGVVLPVGSDNSNPNNTVVGF